MARTRNTADGDESGPKLLRLVFMTALAISLGVFEELADPFGLDTQTDRLSANIFNTITSPFYGRDSNLKLTVSTDNKTEERSFGSRFGQSNIVVLLIDDDYLTAIKRSWPLEPRRYTRILRKLVDAGASAVFVDIYFLQNSLERQQSVARLYTQSTCLVEKSACSTVDENWTCADLADRAPCDEPAAKAGTDIIFAGTLRDPVPAANEVMPPGSALAQMSSAENFYNLRQTLSGEQFPTAAWALYQAWCWRDARCDTSRLDEFPTKPLYLHWGYAPNRMMTDPDLGEFGSAECVAQAGTLIGRLVQSLKVFGWNFIRGFHKQDSLCLYHSQLGLQLFNNLSPVELEELFGGKVVLLGASLKNFPDYQWSPVHSFVPGVFWHAMAVDNLMEFSDKYMTEAEEAGEYFEPIGIAVIFILQAFLSWTINRREEREKLGEMARVKLDLLHGLLIICAISAIVLWMTGLQRWSPANWIGFAMLMFLIDFKPVTAVPRFCWMIFPTVRMKQRPFRFISNLAFSTLCALGMVLAAYCIFVLPHALLLQGGIDDTTISYVYIFAYAVIIIWPCAWKIFRRGSS